MTYKDFLKDNGEGKWQDQWEKWQINRAEDFSNKPKKYVLDMFPYPSGAGLHVGHPEGYTATDIYCRYWRMKGFNVLHPMGWDAFGLPAENYAIKTGTQPSVVTAENVANFKRQIKALGFSYDWEREINTTDPNYYKWTQWIFLQLFKKGLAYEATVPINFCPSCKTGLANEEVHDGKCERCGTEVVKKDMRQWMLRITAYADRLLSGLDKLDWSESIKALQRNWIGRSEGAEVDFRIANSTEKIKVYTTRPDTLFGATYMVLAPEHQLVEELKDQIKNIKEVNKYIAQAKNKSDLERTDLAKDKSGVELKGIKAINPVNQEQIPVWISDYVLASYGTGAIMAVPAHDERDWEFAKKFDLPIVQVVAPFFPETEEPDKARPDKETVYRKSVCAIIKHWEKNEYYCLNWEKYNWKSFVLGGVEEGETFEQAAIRETKEESGYVNVKSIRQVAGEVHNLFYATHKGVNRHAEFQCFYIELKDGKRLQESEIDTEFHEGEWVKAEEVEKYINLDNNLWYWEQLVKGDEAFTDIDSGIMINSKFLNGLKPSEAIGKTTSWLEENGHGKKAVNYKLRDWVFSRQRYWGEPIPLIHCDKCGIVPVNEKDLPLILPEVDKYEPTGTGESPLVNIPDFVKTKCPVCKGEAHRETNTMPQWAGSSWYWLRFIDPKNDQIFADEEKLKYWMPVDVYVGGAEHAVLHLLYGRFWNMVLYDLGYVPVEEPFAKLVNQGLILGEDGEKMSKSRGNVVNPDDVIREQGADAFRMYEMFMGPLEDVKPWNTKGIVGISRFLEKAWNVVDNYSDKNKTTKDSEAILNKTIKKVGEDIENMKFNTAIPAMMMLVNEAKDMPKESLEKFLIILAPFAPHLAEELWSRLGHKKSIFQEAWPKYDESKMKDEEVEMVVQINGKVRAKLKLPTGISEQEAIEQAKSDENVKKYLEGVEIKKTIFVANKLISFVI